MFRVLCLAAVCAVLVSCAAKPPTYEEATALEKKLAADPEIRAWAENVMAPFWRANAKGVFMPCLQAAPDGETLTVRIMVEVRGAHKARQILEDPVTTFSRCVSQNMSVLAWPETPPQLKFFPLALEVSKGTADSVIKQVWSTGPDVANVRRVHFTCDNDEELQVVFYRTLQIADLIRDRKGTELKLMPSGSGFLYGNGAQTIRGKGDALTIESEQQPSLTCKVKT